MTKQIWHTLIHSKVEPYAEPINDKSIEMKFKTLKTLPIEMNYLLRAQEQGGQYRRCSFSFS